MGNWGSKAKEGEPSEEIENITGSLRSLFQRSSQLSVPKCFDRCTGNAGVNCRKCTLVHCDMSRILPQLMKEMATIVKSYSSIYKYKGWDSKELFEIQRILNSYERTNCSTINNVEIRECSKTEKSTKCFPQSLKLFSKMQKTINKRQVRNSSTESVNSGRINNTLSPMSPMHREDFSHQTISSESSSHISERAKDSEDLRTVKVHTIQYTNNNEILNWSELNGQKLRQSSWSLPKSDIEVKRESNHVFRKRNKSNRKKNSFPHYENITDHENMENSETSTDKLISSGIVKKVSPYKAPAVHQNFTKSPHKPRRNERMFQVKSWNSQIKQLSIPQKYIANNRYNDKSYSQHLTKSRSLSNGLRTNNSDSSATNGDKFILPARRPPTENIESMFMKTGVDFDVEEFNSSPIEWKTSTLKTEFNIVKATVVSKSNATKNFQCLQTNSSNTSGNQTRNFSVSSSTQTDKSYLQSLQILSNQSRDLTDTFSSRVSLNNLIGSRSPLELRDDKKYISDKKLSASANAPAFKLENLSHRESMQRLSSIENIATQHSPMTSKIHNPQISNIIQTSTTHVPKCINIPPPPASNSLSKSAVVPPPPPPPPPFTLKHLTPPPHSTLKKFTPKSSTVLLPTFNQFTAAPPPPPPPLPPPHPPPPPLSINMTIGTPYSSPRNSEYCGGDFGTVRSLPSETLLQRFRHVPRVPGFCTVMPSPKTQVKRLAWKKCQPNDIENSVWENIVDSLNNSSCSSLDTSNVESVFGKEQRNSPVAKKETPVKRSVQFLDNKRSLTMSVLLKAFKMPVTELAKCISECDASLLEIDMLNNLSKSLPDKDTVVYSRKFENELKDLEAAERFCFELSNIPLYELKIELMIQSVQVPPALSRLKSEFSSLVSLGEIIHRSESLQEFLSKVLELGNFLNSGSYAGNAFGFHLQYLETIWTTKSEKTKVSVLEYLMRNYSNAVDFILEFESIEMVAKLSMSDLLSELNDIKEMMSRISKGMNKHEGSVRSKFEVFLSKSSDSISSVESLLLKVEVIRRKLAVYFCEDIEKFKLEDCISIFSTLCQKIKEVEGKMSKEKLREKKKQERLKAAEERKRKPLPNLGTEIATRLKPSKALPPPGWEMAHLSPREVLMRDIRGKRYHLKNAAEDVDIGGQNKALEQEQFKQKKLPTLTKVFRC